MIYAWRPYWVCIVFLLLGSGCASAVMVEADGSRKTPQPIPSHVTFAVLPTTEVEHDPAFPTYAGLVARELTQRDYKQTEPNVAKFGVYLSYKVTGPSQREATTFTGSAMGTSSMGGTSGYGMSGSSVGGSQGYVSRVVIVVLDLTHSQAADSSVELWRGEARTTGLVNDLPAVAPLLIHAAFRHFGEETPMPVRHAFSEEEAKALRQ